MKTTTLSALLLAAVAIAPRAESAPKDAAARGLDLFIHAPAEAPSGALLPVQVRVFGFATVATPAPLGGATVEAAWDPESLGDKVAKVPPPVAVTCDEAGRGHLDIEVPRGTGRLALLVAARVPGHERTRTVEVKRLPRYQTDLRVSDTGVVPGGTISAWVIVHDRAAGRPAAGKPLDLVLKEGSLVRFARRLATDRAGTASSEVRIPWVDDPDEAWTLSARTAVGHGDEAEAELTLSVREETPQAPTLLAKWTTSKVAPGTRATFRIELRDGAGQGIAELPVRVWTGPKGTTAPTDERAWQRASTEIRADADGNATVTVDTPKTVSPRGSSMTVVARVLVEGHPLSAQDTLDLVAPAPEVEIWPEFGVLVPGQRQRLFLHATLNGKPVAAEFALDGHDLRARVRTNPRGLAEVTWRLPVDVGAKVPDGKASECAGDVAATLRVRWLSQGTDRPVAKSFHRCLVVDREAGAAIRPATPTVRAGEKLELQILGGQGSASVVLDGAGSEPWQSAWLPDAVRGGTIAIPPTARGPWQLTATGLSLGKNQHVLGGRVFVLPKVIPRLVARLGANHRAAPGATVTVDAILDDGHGQPLSGSVGAVVFDKTGGSHPEQLLALDTRRSLTPSDVDDIDAYLGGDKAFEIDRWAALAGEVSNPTAPAFDPVATVDENIDESFRRIVKSLEGAVFESSSDPERLRDVRLRTARGFTLNPEMLTLVTLAMSEAPVTPGGEPWMLADLMSIDSQVRFDNVARRVTRLKLFQLLSALRSYLFDKRLDRDEPALRDPNALLRRMVHDQAIEAGDLLDPWGHAMSFVRSTAPRVPFLSAVPGFRVISAGPDGRFGTADDVADPFQRVLASKTPYADAVEEDRIVDARWDMRVGDETVEAWKLLLEALTGRTLGDDDGEVVLGSSGGGGLGGAGYGMGAGGLAGRHSRGIDPGPAHWLPPVRTDRQGRVRLRAPLGDAETTWQIVVVAIPDDGLPATASVEVTTALPLSVRANAGANWTQGDEVEVALRVRNRTEKPVAVVLQASASGAARLVDPARATQTVPVPARSAATAHLRVRGTAAGTGIIEASVDGGGYSDRLRHEWQIRPGGEIVAAQNAAWVKDATTVGVPSADMPAQGPGRLILEKGIEPALAAALDSLTPQQLLGPGALADAMEVFGRVRAWALVRGGETHALAVRSRELARQASERRELKDRSGNKADWGEPLIERARYWEAVANPGQTPWHAKDTCPPAKSLPVHVAIDWLGLARHVDRNAESACFAALRASALYQLAKESDPLMTARALLVLIDATAQTQAAAALAVRLLALVPIRPDGTLLLPDALARDRAARSIVLVALLRTAAWWPADKRALAAKLQSRLYLERDVRGGYGSAEATRHVVATLLQAESAAPTEVSVRYAQLSAEGRVLGQGSLTLGDAATLQLVPDAASVRIESSAGLLARVERPLFRSFFRPVDPASSPLHLDLAMPKRPQRGGLAPLQVTVRHDVGRQVPLTVRIPLPPGAALAGEVENTRQVQGAVYLRTELGGDALPKVIEVPLRFSLAGKVTMPEATARIADEEIAPARAPARPLLILDR